LVVFWYRVNDPVMKTEIFDPFRSIGWKKKRCRCPLLPRTDMMANFLAVGHLAMVVRCQAGDGFNLVAIEKLTENRMEAWHTLK